jgi:hypothetical protein
MFGPQRGLPCGHPAGGEPSTYCAGTILAVGIVQIREDYDVTPSELPVGSYPASII